MNSPRRLFWLAFFVAVLPLLGWWSYGLFDLDEGFYAAAACEMNRRGEWITPYYNGNPWYEKPILLYWLAKPAIAWFGDAIGPRLPSVLASAGTLLLIGWFARRRLSAPFAGPMAMLVLGSSLLAVVVGRMMLTDAVLVLAFTSAMLTFWESLVGDRRWRLVTAACLGLAVLAKGPVALALFVVIATFTYARERDMRPAFRGQWLLGTGLLALVVASWYWPAYAVGGQAFVQDFLIVQNLGRFSGGDAAHTTTLAESLVFYPAVLLIGMLPWIFWIPKALREPLSRDGEPAMRRYLTCWALAVLILFSISGAKLPHYILPVLPPLALIVAGSLAARWPGRRLLAWAGVWTLCIGVFAQIGFSWWYRESGQAEAHALARWAKAQDGLVIVYQLPRQKGQKSSRTKLDETSLPSLAFVLDAPTIKADDVGDLLGANAPVWVFTRRGRLDTTAIEDLLRFGRRLSPAASSVPQENYRLYLLEDL